ncbi:MAG: UDP-N-acetylglucosamine 2-epimerase (non-hydrolyzing) [Geobacteraceae bacterium]|nr:UDP-N-acetylglucosamine 2-epimerase (non-hydrolyzing) [Geobacteraceae bacterium]
MKLVTVVGARPQFVKCAPLSREIRKEHTEILVHTGQHYDPEMSDVFFRDLAIPEPDYHLGVGSGSHGEQTGEILARIEQVLLKEKPDMVIVFGDTNSTLAGALSATKLHIPVAHVEAGLRSFDRSMPEEINRVVTDHVSDLLFCPTRTAVRNLADEGITRGVHLVGDVMVDALEYNRHIAAKKSRILERFGLPPGGYLVVTVHRPANTDNWEHMDAILSALGESGQPVLFPVHPRTKKMLNEFGCWSVLPKNIIVTEPLGYLDMLQAMANARKILTDSGGMQKEAYLLGVPCITLRDTTEWVETVEDGWNVLVGADRGKISEAIVAFSPEKTRSMIYGEVGASGRIAKILGRRSGLSGG